MRYYEILSEGRSQKVDWQAIYDARDRYSVAFNQALKGNKIYRGLPFNEDLLHANPTQTVRKSQNTTNFYTLLMDNLASWKNYPKRSRALICATSEGRAMDYGYAYVVLPEGNPMIGVCGENDLWDSFPNVMSTLNLGGMDRFNEVIGSIADGYGLRMDDDDYQSFIKDLEKADEYRAQGLELDRSAVNRGFYRAIEYLFKQKVPLIRTFESLMMPSKNGFDLTSLGNLNATSHQGKEVWFNSPAWLVNVDSWDRFVKLMTDKGNPNEME